MNQVIEGIITSGMGKGAIFMSIDYYKNKIKEKLDFEPYPGTLNLKIDREDHNLMKNKNTVRIESFKEGNKNYGGATCIKINIDDLQGAIIIPDLTEHDPEMVEIISPLNLKSELNIQDGSKVRIELLQ